MAARTPTWLRWHPFLATAVAVVVAGCERPEPPPPPPPPAVTAATVATEEMTEFLYYTGTLQPMETAEVRARVPGFLEEVRFEPSDDVVKDQVLFVIEREPYEVAVNIAQAEVQRADAELELAKTQLQRLEDALSKGGVNEIEVIEQRATVEKAGAVLEAARANLEQARLNLSYTEVRSPFDGRVSENFVDVGNLVGSGENTLLTTVVRQDKLYAYFDVSESIMLRYLGRGDRSEEGVRRAFPPTFLGLQNGQGYPYEGRVDFLDNRVDESTGTLRVRAIFENPDRGLYPGLFARLRVPFEEVDDAVLVPEASVGTDLAGKYVFVIDGEGLAQKRPVTLGERVEGGRVRILEGLSAGDRYVVEGLQRARPGMPVTIEAGSGASAEDSGGGG